MKLILLLIPFLLVGCTGNDSSISSSLGEEFSLKPGQQTSISGEDLTIEFKSVSSDSRCPTDAQCIWAGNAEVNVELTKTGNSSSTSTIQLNTAGTTDFPNQANYLNYTIRITELQPYPKVDSTIEQADYKAKYIVSKS